MVYYVANDKKNPIIIPDDIKPIGSGNEGVVYNIGGVAVKIINNISLMTENKIWNLSQKTPPILIMMPMQPIYDKTGKYSGYIMKLLDCTNAEDVRLNFMHCDDLIRSINFINNDARLLAEQKVALRDTTLRNAVISNSNNLVNIIDSDRFITLEDPECHFTVSQQFIDENNYWVNKLWYSLFYKMIDLSTLFPGADYRTFRFYMREKLKNAMEQRAVPEFIQEEVKDFNTVEDYMRHKRQYVKSKGILDKY